MRTTVSVLLVGVALAGCGAGSLNEDERTTIADTRLASAYVALDAIDHDACIRRAGLECDGEGLGSKVDDVIAIYREKPDAEMDDLTVREHLQDIASSLEGAAPDLVARIDRALGS